MPALLPELTRRCTEFPQLALNTVRLDSPVANPGKIIGAPINYRGHILEANADPAIHHGKTFTSLDQYGLFLKAGSSLIGPSEAVQLRFPERRSDHEVELAVIIGKEARFVARDHALEYVLGYCIGLDMTVRGPEFPGFRKSIDSYAVLGPWIVTADEIADPNALDLRLSVNGQIRQQSNTDRLIFNVQRLIEYASGFYTLYPGDVIMTGTPEGVSQVHPGDVMHATIEQLGELRIQIASAWATRAQ
jgi:2-keto-4-pentenoate hydratase/2-oxohepta-3-ene-1,7-dioic acid hydratase in catechol pathway